MGLFSSSWKYYAFAATTPLFEDELDYPHTFQKVLLQGISAGDDFSNILRYTLLTDMYARAKAMVRYATRDVDPYIRGLPTSNLVVRGGHKNWIENAILREIKMPLEDFFWLRFGIFDAHYVGCKFIHDHYMDIEYFPWPDGCLPDIKNPNFDDGFEFWIPTDFEHNPTERVAELTANNGTLYSEMIGEVNPGDIISLRAVCCRGSDDPAQTGQINITFYNSSGSEISTASAANTTTPGDEWELLTVIATAPAGTATCKAWAGGTMVGSTLLRWAGDVRPENPTFYAPYTYISTWPSSENYDGSLIYYEAGPSYDWGYLIQAWENEPTGAGQAFWKITLDSTVSGTMTPIMEGGDPINAWYDIWDEAYECYLTHPNANGVMEWHNITIHVTTGDGQGGPDLNNITSYPMEMLCYWGEKEYKFFDSFAENAGDIYDRLPTSDRRHWNGGAQWAGWKDLFYDAYQNYDYGWISVNTTNSWARSSSGDVTNEALYSIDSGLTDLRIESRVMFDAQDFDVNVHATGGVAYRVQDYNNFWLLAVKNPEVTNPVLAIYKVVGGTHTLVAGAELTGYGPLSARWGEYIYRLTCVDDVMVGELCLHEGGGADAPFDQPLKMVTATDPAFNTSTKVGLWAEDPYFVWLDHYVMPWPLGAIDWNIFVWDSSSESTSVTDCGVAWNMFYVYEGSNTKTAHPYDSSYSVDNDGSGIWGSVVNWRLTPFPSDTILCQIQAVSGDTDQLLLWEYGNPSNTFSFGDWVDAYRLLVGLQQDNSSEGAGSKTATFQARFCLDDGTGSFGDRKPVAGTESVWKSITLSVTCTGPC